MKIALLTLLYACGITQVYASLECIGEVYGMKSQYVFNKTGTDNLKLDYKITLNNDLISEGSGTAVYTSTLVSELEGEVVVAESYYYFVNGEKSYTELIGLSRDLQSMSRSRPDPESSNGNYLKFNCTGKP